MIARRTFLKRLVQAGALMALPPLAFQVKEIPEKVESIKPACSPVYVTTSGSGNMDGTSWENAMAYSDVLQEQFRYYN
jgi:hypothetical protein